jgi:hypothetical protein
MTKARTTSPLTRNQKKKMSEVLSEVKLRKIVPEVPRDEAERRELLEDLQVMGCSGFLEKPWGFKDDRIVRELLDGVSNEFDNSIRGQPVRWTEECWREVYHFGKGGGGLAKPKGWVFHRRLQGSAAQEAAGVPCSDCVSGKAQPDHCHLGEHNFRRIERRKKGELGEGNHHPSRSTGRTGG